MDENLTLDDPSALDAPVEDTQPSLALNMPEASPIVYPVQQTSNPLDKVSADIAAKRAALAALPPIQRRVIDLSRIWTAPTEIPKPQDFTSYAGDKYSALDTSAKQSVWDGYVRSELPKSLPAGYTPEQLAAAKARFEASNPRPQDTGFYSYLKSGVASTTNAISSAVSTKTPESLARATIENIKDQIDDPEIAALQKNIAQQVKDAGGSTLWNELKVRSIEYGSNPRLFAKMALQQLPNSIPSMAGAIAGAAVGAKTGAVAGGTAGTFVIPGIGTVGGGAVGGVIGGAVGGVMGSFLMGAAPEVGSELLQRVQTEAQAAGVNVTNKPALEAFIAERGVDHFVAPSIKKGVVTAGVDSLYNAVIVGRLGSVASTQAKVILKTEADLAKGVITADQAAVNLAKAQGRVAAAQTPLAKATHAAGTAGIESLGEGASEAAGRFYADNKIDWGDVADETLFGLAHGTAFEAGGKVWSAATGAASEYDQAVAKLNARLSPPATPSTTATATTPAATDTTLTPEAPAVEPTVTDTTPVLPTIDDAAIARLKEIVPDFNETANITENGALSLDPDQTAALQQVIENLPAADQQFLYDLALGVNANETTSTKTDPTANQQAAISAQETIPGSTAPASSDTVGVSSLPADGSGASTGAVLDGRPASENRTDTGPATSEVVGGPVVDNVNTTSTEGPGSPGTDGTGTTTAVNQNSQVTPVDSLVDTLVSYDIGGQKVIGALRRQPDGLFVQDAQGNETFVESGESGASAEALGLRPYQQPKSVRQSLIRSENRTRPDDFTPQVVREGQPPQIPPEVQQAVQQQNAGIQQALAENSAPEATQSELSAWVDLLSTEYDDNELAFIAYEIQRGLSTAGKTGTERQVINEIKKIIDENYRPFASPRSSEETSVPAATPDRTNTAASSTTATSPGTTQDVNTPSRNTTNTTTQGNENATSQINQQESVQQQRDPGDQTRQAPEAGRRDRVQRAEQSTATQEKVATQNVTEKTLDTLRLRAEEVLSRLSTEETIAVRDYFEQVQPPDDGGKVSIRTDMRKLLGDLEARIEQGDAALRAGKQALTADETRALSDAITGGIIYATSEDLTKNVPVDNLVERALRNNDVRGALTILSRSASTPLARAVATRLLSQLPTGIKIKIDTVRNVDTTQLGGRRASGSYQHSTKTITLDPEANGLTERTVLHEVTHAVTLEAIRNPDTAIKRAAVKELQSILKHAKSSLPGVEHYGFKNLEEFVAEIFSNPVLQYELYNIKTGPKASLWSRVVNAVLKSTGLEKIIGLINDDNLLSKSLTAADLLMQPASAKAAENASAVAAEEPPSTEALAAPTDLAAQTETDLAALQGGRKPTIGIQNESVGTKLRTLKAAAREALIDYQVPIYNWLESIYGAGKAATNATWQTLKTIGPKRDELNHQFKIGTLHDINMVGKELATKYGLKIEEAVSTLGEYAKYVHVPEANATLLARLQKAANDANADLRNATTDLALAQQEYDQAKLDVKSKKAPVANAKTFSRADAELKQATKAYNDAVKIRDAADAALQAGPDRQAGHLTDAQAQDSKAYLESKYDVALLQKGQQLLVKANRDALDASVRAGVVDAKTAASLKATYPNYVPLFVDKDSLGTDPWSAMDGAPDLFSQSINATLIKERKGYLENSDVRSDNAYINTIAKVAATNSRVAAQPFKNQLLVMALNKDAGKELSIKPLRGNNPDPRGMVAKDSKGQQYQVMFKSDQLADAVYSRGVEEFGSTGLPGMIASVGSIIARSVTQYTLAFAPVNLVRDVGEKTLLVRSRKFLDANGKPVDGRALAGTMTKLLATDFLSIITSINQAVRDKAPATPGKYYDLIKEMMSEGGLSTWGDIFQKSRIEVLNEVKKLQGWRRLPAAFNDVVHKYNHTFDMMSSTLAYTAMKQAGMTPRAAAFATMDLMNFRNKGKKTGWIRALYLFANPALQSGANFIDHVKTKQGKIDAVVLGVLALAIYQLALMTGDDDELLGNEIDQRNTTDIERSMVFMVDGVPVKVPVPYGMAQIMWAFAVNGTRFARGVTSGADALADSIKSTFKSISPISPSEIEATKNPLMFMVQTLTPSTLRPIVDVATNTSAFGAPITKPRLNPKIPASAQGRENTEGFWKDTAKKLYETTGADVAPEKIKALWLGFTAGPIADATKAITFDKDEKGLTTSFRDDLRYLMPLGFNRLVGGDSTFLQAKYYDSLKQAENLVKKYGLAEIDSNRTLNTGGKAVARKAILDKAPGITDNDKKLVAAYYAERAIVTKEGQSKKKELARAKTPESISDINSKYEDASESRMRDFLSRLK